MDKKCTHEQYRWQSVMDDRPREHEPADLKVGRPPGLSEETRCQLNEIESAALVALRNRRN